MSSSDEASDEAEDSMSSSDEIRETSMSSSDEDRGNVEEELEMEKFVLFLTDKLQAMHFIVQVKKKDEEERICTLIQEHFGSVTTDLSQFGPHTIVLVDDNALTWKHDKDVFKASYVDRCVKSGVVLDITKFLKDRSKVYVLLFNFMNIVYFRKFSWTVVPPEFRLQEKSLCSGSAHSAPKYLPKMTRGLPYSRREKEAILTYVAKHFSVDVDTLKGVSLWRKMEEKKVCNRTWQSMKEHFLKSILKNLDCFDCISESDKKLIRHAVR